MKKIWLLVILTVALSAAVQSDPLFGSAGHWPVLGDGDDHPTQVKTAQILLASHGFPCRVTGVYDNQTQDCVRNYCNKAKIQESGGFDCPLLDATVWERLIVPLHLGNKGLAVRAAQVLLRAKGYRVVVDGKFGKQTERAIRRFQDDRGFTSVTPGTIEHFTWCDLVGEGSYKGGGG